MKYGNRMKYWEIVKMLLYFKSMFFTLEKKKEAFQIEYFCMCFRMQNKRMRTFKVIPVPNHTSPDTFKLSSSMILGMDLKRVWTSLTWERKQLTPLLNKWKLKIDLRQSKLINLYLHKFRS